MTTGVNEGFDNEAVGEIKSIPHFLPVSINDLVTRHELSYFVEFTPPKKSRKERKKERRLKFTLITQKPYAIAPL